MKIIILLITDRLSCFLSLIFHWTKKKVASSFFVIWLYPLFDNEFFEVFYLIAFFSLYPFSIVIECHQKYVDLCTFIHSKVHVTLCVLFVCLFYCIIHFRSCFFLNFTSYFLYFHCHWHQMHQQVIQTSFF